MAVPVVQSYSGSSTSTGTVTTTAPTGIVDNDLLVFVASTDWAAAGTAAYTPPAGLTELFPYSRTNAGTAAGVSYQSWYKIASSEAGSYILTLGSARLTAWSITRIDGQDTTTPIDGTAGTIVDSGEPIHPSIITSVNNCLILHPVAWDLSKTFVSAPSGDIGVGSVDVSGHDQWIYRNSQVTAGAHPAGTWDISAAAQHIAVTVAIKEVQGAPPAATFLPRMQMLGVG